MAYVIHPNKPPKQVKDLGWLLRARSSGKPAPLVSLVATDNTKYLPNPLDDNHYTLRNPEYDGQQSYKYVLIAAFGDGTLYVTKWAAREVMSQWLSDSPHWYLFGDVPIRWFGINTIVSKGW